MSSINTYCECFSASNPELSEEESSTMDNFSGTIYDWFGESEPESPSSPLSIADYFEYRDRSDTATRREYDASDYLLWESIMGREDELDTTGLYLPSEMPLRSASREPPPNYRGSNRSRSRSPARENQRRGRFGVPAIDYAYHPRSRGREEQELSRALASVRARTPSPDLDRTPAQRANSPETTISLSWGGSSTFPSSIPRFTATPVSRGSRRPTNYTPLNLAIDTGLPVLYTYNSTPPPIPAVSTGLDTGLSNLHITDSTTPPTSSHSTSLDTGLSNLRIADSNTSNSTSAASPVSAAPPAPSQPTSLDAGLSNLRINDPEEEWEYLDSTAGDRTV